MLGLLARNVYAHVYTFENVEDPANANCDFWNNNKQLYIESPYKSVPPRLTLVIKKKKAKRRIISGAFRAVYRLLRFKFASQCASCFTNVRIVYSRHAIMFLVRDKRWVLPVSVLDHRIYDSIPISNVS